MNQIVPKRKSDRAAAAARHDRTIAEVAALAGCSWWTAYRTLTERALPYKKDRGRVNRHDVERYADGSRTAKQIAAILRCQPGYVRKTCSRYGFKLRAV